MRAGHLTRFRFVPAFLVAVGLAACGMGTRPDGRAPAGATSDGSSGPAREAPDFALRDLGGQLVRLSDFQGQVRLVDFWATWCAPCREEIPVFNELQREYGERGFKLLAIAMDDAPEQVVPVFARRHGISYSVLFGTEEVAEAYGPILGYPTKFLVDRQGRIVGSFIGPVPKSVLAERIRALLAQDRAS
jgi:thiol-disulfide isomerase/thioredoxin